MDGARPPVVLTAEPARQLSDFPLALADVCKRWRGAGGPVLERLDLRLEPGSVTWIGGRNGAGKTTMLRIAAGLIEPDSGYARVFGLSARRQRDAYQRLVSFLPAGDRGLYARLRVRHQLQFWARISMAAPSRVPALVERAVSQFQLTELAEQRVDRMSMGQRQRLRLAMTFMSAAEVILLDEPLTSLDAEGCALVLEAVEQARGRGGAVLWCSPTGERPAVSLDGAFTLEHGGLAPA